MAKKKIEDFEVEVKTKKVKASVKKDENKKEFTLDTDKLDVVVTEENGEIKAEVQAENNLLRAIGNKVVKIFSRNFRRRK
jgi:ribosome-associated translation inhibitor RaiA